jgi:hypothetical protein
MLSTIQLEKQLQEKLERERVPAFLWPLARGAEDVRVIHKERDPLLIVDGELVAFWTE